MLWILMMRVHQPVRQQWFCCNTYDVQVGIKHLTADEVGLFDWRQKKSWEITLKLLLKLKIASCPWLLGFKFQKNCICKERLVMQRNGERGPYGISEQWNVSKCKKKRKPTHAHTTRLHTALSQSVNAQHDLFHQSTGARREPLACESMKTKLTNWLPQMKIKQMGAYWKHTNKAN